ncbi:uroporphyrinogen-III C-methyltransferase [Guyparkeria sp.]|uniref:uroporphyrinogen-III C-methyltransferase n=1 Tax=Guyparkeria sp. TaxID=2035736 RepID=UPI003970691C
MDKKDADKRAEDKAAEAPEKLRTDEKPAEAPDEPRIEEKATAASGADESPAEATADERVDVAASADETGKDSPGGQPAATTGEQKPAGVSRGTFGFWLALLFLVLLGLAAAGGWYFWQLGERQQAAIEQQSSVAERLEGELATVTDDLQANRAAVDALESRSDEIRREVESALSGRQDELDQRQDRLAARVAEIDDRLSRGEIAWKTAEIGFLLTRAQERLVISRDPEGAMTALELADERLTALSRPHWLPLRSAISDAIGELEAAGEGDRVGQALELRRLADRVEDWPLAGEAENARDEPTPSESETKAEDSPEDAAWYERAWSGATSWLGSQVTVTRSDTPTRVRERVATDREMRLWLTAVRESLLARDHRALRTTVDEASSWLEEHYATDAAGPAAARSALETARTRFAARDFPPLDAVLETWEKGVAQERALAEDAERTASAGKEADR